jgi:hypothetical protein
MPVDSSAALRQALIDIAVESWRFRQVFERAMSKLDAGDSARYISQYLWFDKKVDAALKNAGLRIVNIEGQCYDIGMAATPLNVDDFEPEDRLFVEQMVEPIIMDGDSIVKTGTVILGRVDK